MNGVLLALALAEYHGGRNQGSCSQASFSKSSKSSSSSQSVLRTTLGVFTLLPDCSSCSVNDASICFSWSSLTFALNWPERASEINLFSTSSAREALTSRILPSLSAAAGSRIWFRIEDRCSSCCLRWSPSSPSPLLPPASPPPCCLSCARRAARICKCQYWKGSREPSF